MVRLFLFGSAHLFPTAPRVPILRLNTTQTCDGTYASADGSKLFGPPSLPPTPWREARSIRRGSVLAAAVLLLASPVSAGSRCISARTYIVQMSHPAGRERTCGLPSATLEPGAPSEGLVDKGGPGADLAATISPHSDVGRWYGSTSARRSLYTRTLKVGRTPADQIVNDDEAWFSVTARLITPDVDRADELECLVHAVRQVGSAYRLKGRQTVDGARSPLHGSRGRSGAVSP